MGDSSASHKLMVIEPTFLAEWRQDCRMATDRRLLYHPLLKEAIEVVKWKSRSRRPSERRLAIYVSHPPPPIASQPYTERFASEGHNGFMWFFRGEEPILENRMGGTLQKVLEMTVLWLGVAWCQVDDCELRCQVEIFISFDEGMQEDWDASWDIETLHLHIRISLTGIEAFHSSTNEPERNFIRCVLSALEQHLPKNLSTKLQALVDAEQSDPKARHIHHFISRDAATWVQKDVTGACYWPAEEARQLYRWRIIVRDLGLGAFKCSEANYREALDGLVEGLWQKIEAELNEFNLLHFVSACFHALTNARVDLTELDLTTGALLAVHPAEDEEENRIHAWRQGLNAAPLTLRTLVEICIFVWTWRWRRENRQRSSHGFNGKRELADRG